MLDHQVVQAPQVNQARQDLKDLMVTTVNLDQRDPMVMKVHQEFQAYPANKVFPENQDHKAVQDQMDHLAHKDLMDNP